MLIVSGESHITSRITKIVFVVGEKAMLYVVPTEDCGFASIAGEKEKYLLDYLTSNPVIAARNEKARVTFFWVISFDYGITDPKFYFRKGRFNLRGTRTEKYRL